MVEEWRDGGRDGCSGRCRGSAANVEVDMGDGEVG